MPEKKERKILTRKVEENRQRFGMRGPTVRLTPYLLPLSFAALIAIGTILLVIPPATNDAGWANPIDAFFTATSAVCVTGLVVVETGSYWSMYGQAVILALIQLGGFGIVAGATLIMLAVNGRISFGQRLALTQTLGGHGSQALSSTIKSVALFFVGFELIGALVIFYSVAGHEPLPAAAWMSIFHSISAFNNSGFDILPSMESISAYQSDALFVTVTALLIFLGGISFLVIQDVFVKRRFGRFSTDTKMVIVITGALLLTGWIVIFFSEFNSSALAGMGLGDKVLNSLFLSVTSRTAGFSTFSLANASTVTLFFVMFLMFIGGATGSTAGGVKVNTFGVVAAYLVSVVKKHPGTRAFGREFSSEQVKQATAIILLAAGFIGSIVFALTIVEPFPFLSIVFETVSAFGTVGLSTGITPNLTLAGKLLIIVTIFVGRLGPVTLVALLTGKQRSIRYRYPQETIRIG